MEQTLTGNDRSDDKKKRVKFHNQFLCKYVEHLDEEMDKVLKLEEEGVMSKDPESFMKEKNQASF